MIRSTSTSPLRAWLTAGTPMLTASRVPASMSCHQRSCCLQRRSSAVHVILSHRKITVHRGRLLHDAKTPKEGLQRLYPAAQAAGLSLTQGSKADATGAHTPSSVQHGQGGGGGGTRRRFGDGNGSDDSGAPGISAGLMQVLLTLVAALLSVALPAPAAAAAAAAASKKSNLVSREDDSSLASSWQIDAFVERMWQLSGPIINNMGFSGLLGASAAAALKWVGRTLAASVGMGLILIQVLSHYNVITVNWSVVHKQARQVLDTTGDGRLDHDDFKRVVKQGLVILSEGVPSVSGFLVGFLVGLKVF